MTAAAIVTVAVYSHPHGEDISVFETRSGALRWRNQIGSEWWDTEFPDVPRPTQDIGAQYFLRMQESLRPEFFRIETTEVRT